MRPFASILPVLLAGAWIWDSLATAQAAPRPPNLVLILIDDLGATDLGCYGSSFFRTPHLDRMAAEGMRFTQAYACGPVCSPTRASLMTGQHPARLNPVSTSSTARSRSRTPAATAASSIAYSPDT